MAMHIQLATRSFGVSPERGDQLRGVRAAVPDDSTTVDGLKLVGGGG